MTGPKLFVPIVLTTLFILFTRTSSAIDLAFVEKAIGTFTAFSIEACDLDGDGNLDAVACSQFEDRVSWFENDGMTPPGFTEHVIEMTRVDPTDVYVANLDGDTDLDIVVSYAEGTLAWYENLGGNPPTFSEHVVSTSFADFSSAHAADIDGDSNIDLISASSVDDTIAWYESDGGSPPGFTECTVTISAETVVSVLAVDIDGDSDQDLVFGTVFSLGTSLGYFENLGGEPVVFTEQVIALSGNSFEPVVADLDGDLDLDLVVPDFFGGDLREFRSDGEFPPGFQENKLGATAFSVSVADLDDNGLLDIVRSSSEGLSWIDRNVTELCPGEFQEDSTDRVINDVGMFMAVCTGDFDGDLDIDVMTSNSGVLTLFENDGPAPPPPPPVVPDFVRGDPDGDLDVDFDDVVLLVNYLCCFGVFPDPLPSGDANDDGGVGIADATYLMRMLAGVGPPPPPPFPAVGQDPTPGPFAPPIAPGVILSVSSVCVQPGDVGEIEFRLTSDQPLDGLTVALGFNADSINIVADTLDVSGTPLESAGVELVQHNVDNDCGNGDGGELVIVVSLDGLEPLEGNTLPPVDDQLIMRIELEVFVDTPQGTTTPLTFQVGDGAGLIDIDTIVSIGGEAFRPVLVNGSVTATSNCLLFQRGDANDDGQLTIADPIFTLAHIFQGQSATCLDALDSDDDGLLGISDAFTTICWLFCNPSGIAPRAPFPTCGVDPTPGDPLDCDPAASSCP